MQRQKVYNAEVAAFGPARDDGYSVAEMQAMVDKWLASAVVRRRYPMAAHKVTVTDGRSRRRGGYKAGWHEIAMPRATRTKWYLLHEVAHALTFNRLEPGHGWRFAECYLYLVRVYLGKGAEEKLRGQFKAHRVKHRRPRKRVMTAAQREAARQRMLDWHAERRAA